MDRLLQATRAAEERHFWFHGFRRFVQPLLDASTRVSTPRILDCGCGTGANLAMLDRRGPAFGFDLTLVGLQYARAAGRRRIARASVSAVPFPACSFDIVTSFDVLYCLQPEAETAAIREMHRVLRPGGAAVINVAAMRLLHGAHSVFGGEVRRYSRPELKRKLEAAGFLIERLTYTNASLFPLMLAVRLAQRLRRARPADVVSADITAPAAPINAALTGLLRLEAIALRRFDMPFGSSLLCLARKPET